MKPDRSFSWKSLCLGLTLAIGAALCWGFVSLWGGLLGSQLWRRPGGVRLEYVIVTPQGEPLIEQYLSDGEVRYRTLEGATANWSRSQRAAVQYWLPGPARWDAGVPSKSISSWNDGGHPRRYWYYVKDWDRSGFGYLSIFDPSSKLLLANVSATGTVSWPPTVDEQFDVREATRPLSTLYYGWQDQEPNQDYGITPQNPVIIAQGRANIVNLETRELMPIESVEGVLSSDFVNALETRERNGKPTWESFPTGEIALRTADRIVYVKPQGEITREWRLPPEVAEQGTRFFALPDNQLLAEVDESHFDSPHQLTRLFWLGAEGQAVREERLQLHHGGMEFDAFLAVRVSGSPVIDAVFELVALPFIYCYIEHVTYAAALSHTIGFSWSWLALNVIAAAVCLALAVQHARRHKLPLHPVWGAFVLLLGLPGLLGYLWHRRWPPVELPAPPALRGVEVLIPA